jgi:hypothetical protein
MRVLESGVAEWVKEALLFWRKEAKNVSRVLRTKLHHGAKFLAPQASVWRIVSAIRRVAPVVAPAPMNKSFLLLFFKKEALPLLKA